MGFFSRKKSEKVVDTVTPLDDFATPLGLDAPQNVTSSENVSDSLNEQNQITDTHSGDIQNNISSTNVSSVGGENRLAELEVENASLLKQNQFMTGTNDSLNTKLQDANSRLSVFEENENTQINDLERNLSNANVTISSLQDTLTEMTSKFAKSEAELENVRNSYEEKIQTIESDRNQLANNLVATQADLDDAKVRNDELARMNYKLRNDTSTNDIESQEQVALIQMAAREYVERAYTQYRNTFEDNKQLVAENDRLRAGRNLPPLELIDDSSPEYLDLKLKYDKLITEVDILSEQFNEE